MIEDNHLYSERGGEDQSSRFFSPLLSPWKISKHRRVEISHAATNKFLDGSSSFQRNANIDLIDDIATIFAYVFNTVKGWKDFGCEIRHHSSSKVKRIILILSRSISLHFSYFRLLWPYFTGQHRRSQDGKFADNSRHSFIRPRAGRKAVPRRWKRLERDSKMRIPPSVRACRAGRTF